MKALIITDIDYPKKYTTITEIEESNTTNGAIKAFYGDEHLDNDNPTVKEIYEWDGKTSDILVQFQKENDGYARTLEEAMLLVYLDEKIAQPFSRGNWKTIRCKNALKFSIPREGNKFTVRDIIDATGNNSKTEFMYSVILNDLNFKMLPNYIREGLLWLQR